mgnify:CR=1 FL=1
MSTLKIQDIEIEVIKKKIKNIHLAVYPPNGRVRLAAPIQVNDESIRLFAVSKLSWIKKQQKKFREQEREAKREYTNRESHYYQGRRYLLQVEEGSGHAKVEIKNKKYLFIQVKPGSSREKIEKILIEWYRAQIKKQIPELITKWENVLGLRVKDWGVKRMKTKWGSCNPQAGRIWLNLELIKKRVHCLEYILVHEMLHLKERKHNEKFIQNLNKFMPKWKSYKKELNDFPVQHVDWRY